MEYLKNTVSYPYTTCYSTKFHLRPLLGKLFFRNKLLLELINPIIFRKPSQARPWLSTLRMPTMNLSSNVGWGGE